MASHDVGNITFQVEQFANCLCCRFHGAYCTILEAEPLYDVFGDMDVVAPTLPEMAEKIIAATL